MMVRDLENKYYGKSLKKPSRLEPSHNVMLCDRIFLP